MIHIFRNISKVVTANQTNPEALLGSEAAASLEEYSKAMEFLYQKNWSQAEVELKRCSEILKKTDQIYEPSHSMILQRTASVQRAQGKFRECESSLEQVVGNYLKVQSKYKTQLELSYQTLFKQYLYTNLNKALHLGEVLQREDNWTGLQKETQKNIKFLYATALTLQGKDYFKAKKVYYDLIKMNPEVNSCFVYHNLGTTHWLHMREFSGNFGSLQGFEQDDYKKATLDFIEAVPNLQKAVQLFEGFPEIYTIESGLGFKNKLTGLSLTNIAEIYLEQLEVDTAHKWINLALKFYEDLDKNEIARAMHLTSVLMKAKGDFKYAESVARIAVECSRDFLKVMALENLTNILEKSGKADEKLGEKAVKLVEDLPYWTERSYLLHVPNWTI